MDYEHPMKKTVIASLIAMTALAGSASAGVLTIKNNGWYTVYAEDLTANSYDISGLGSSKTWTSEQSERVTISSPGLPNRVVAVPFGDWRKIITYSGPIWNQVIEEETQPILPK